MKSQFTSEKRVEHDPLGDNALKELYKAYAENDLSEFRQYCEGVVNKGTGKKEKKVSFCLSIRGHATKEKILATTQNFIMAGMGLGV